MRHLFLLFSLLLSVVAASPLAHANARTEVRLILDKKAAKPGETILAGVELTMQPNWHTCWINPGASGDATRVEWYLPAGYKAGPLEYPVPEKHDFDGLWTYVYHGIVTLVVPIEIPANAPPGKISIRGKATWLECEKSCVPGDALIEAELVIGNESTPTAEASQILASRAKVPKLDAKTSLVAFWEKSVGPTDESRVLILEHGSAGIKDPEFYSYPADGYEITPETQVEAGGADKVRLKKEVKKFKGEWPTTISGVLLTSKETGVEVRDVPIRQQTLTSSNSSNSL